MKKVIKKLLKTDSYVVQESASDNRLALNISIKYVSTLF